MSGEAGPKNGGVEVEKQVWIVKIGDNSLLITVAT